MAGSDTIWLVFELDTSISATAHAPFPDIEAVMAAWLRSGSISGLDDRVYTEVPADPVYPLAVVRRVGGVPAVRQYLDAANLQIDVWGGAVEEDGDPAAVVRAKEVAHDIAAAIRVRAMQLEGQSVDDPVGAFISAVEDSLTLTWLPDPEVGRGRYLFSVMVYNRGL